MRCKVFSKQEKRRILCQSRYLLMYNKITLPEICDKLMVSERELRYIYNDFLGCSPKKYILSAKICKARTLLRITRLSVVEISSLIGYDNPSQMSAYFKQKYGITPTKYRQNIKQLS